MRTIQVAASCCDGSIRQHGERTSAGHYGRHKRTASEVSTRRRPQRRCTCKEGQSWLMGVAGVARRSIRWPAVYANKTRVGPLGSCYSRSKRNTQTEIKLLLQETSSRQISWIRTIDSSDQNPICSKYNMHINKIGKTTTCAASRCTN